MLASGGDDQTIRLWGVHTGFLIRTLTGFGSIVWSIAFSPDGELIVCLTEDGKVIMLEAGPNLKTLTRNI
jgi:WD40 repeat protein